MRYEERFSLFYMLEPFVKIKLFLYLIDFESSWKFYCMCMELLLDFFIEFPWWICFFPKTTHYTVSSTFWYVSKSDSICHPNLFFFRIVLAILVPLTLHMDFRNSLYVSLKNIQPVERFIRIALYMNLGRIDHNTEFFFYQEQVYI